jgi:hypothetical protein
MEIKIDKEPINYSLDNETTLGEVVHGIEDWLDNAGMLIGAMRIDDKELPVQEREQWQSLPLESITELDVETVMLYEAIYEELQIVRLYVQNLSEAVLANDTHKIRELKNDFSIVGDYLEKLLRTNNTDRIEGLLEKEDEQARKTVIQFLDSIRLLINERIREIEEPREELQRLTALLEKTNNDLREVSLLLQTGKDKEAMDLVITFTELSQKLLRILQLGNQLQVIDSASLTLNGTDINGFYTELNSFFTELQEAFESKDSVLIGDIFEYEVAPRIDNLLATLKRYGEADTGGETNS